MAKKIEVFSAGCPMCRDAVDLVRRVAGPRDRIEVLDLNDPGVARRAAGLGVRAVPAVAVGGELAACCRTQGVSEEVLRAAGVGA